MTNEIEQGLHEKLCAYVLDELHGAERAEVERELLRSPDLRAEKARLEATIGMVRGALAGSEQLSPALRADIVSSAPVTAPPNAFERVPWMRIAAGIGAISLSWALWQNHVMQGSIDEQRDARVARAPALKKDAGEQLKSLGYAGGDTTRQLRKLGYTSADAPLAAAKSKAEEPVQVVGEMRDEVAQLPPLSRTVAPGESNYLQKESASNLGLDKSTLAVDPNAVPRGDMSSTSAVLVVNESKSSSQQQPTSSGAPAIDGVSAGIGGAAAPQAPTAASGTYSSRKMGPGTSKGRAGGPTRLAGPTAGDSRMDLELRFGQGTPGPSSPGPSTGGYKGPGDSIPPGQSAGREVVTRKGDVGLVTMEETNSEDYLAAFGQRQARGDSENLRFADNDEGKRAWSTLTPDEQRAWIDNECRRVLAGCRRFPSEHPRDMFFRFWGDNPFEVTALDALSTFSVDVDTASYTLARRYLNEGQVPEKAQIRTEEFVNYFKSDIPAPTGNATFAVHTDLTPSRFSADAARRMLRVVVRAKDVDKLERPALHLTFVIDVSGSMREQNRLETVKLALRLLIAQLEPRDEIALVSFSSDATLRLPMTPVVDRARIEAAIAPLVPGGGTNSNSGLQLGYAQALAGLDPNVVNRVVFLSDGVANEGETDPVKISAGVAAIREKGIYLNTIGVGMNNHNDVLLEQLADKGDGICTYVDSAEEAKKALVDRFTGAFVPVARDVKIQVEFDPAQVMRYRLLGYENRAIADADFRNDAVDAGEVGAGHQVTALYEIEPTGASSEKPMATVRLRWKAPKTGGNTRTDEASEFAFPVLASSYTSFEAAPLGYRRSVIVAQFAEILRRSIHARGDSLDDLIHEAETLRTQMSNDLEFAEFCTLLVKGKELILRSLPACDELCQAIDLVRSNAYLAAQSEQLARVEDRKLIDELARTNAELEARIRELIRHRLETR